MFYNEKKVGKVRSFKSCEKCGCDLKGKPAISVYNGYESNYYFCTKCVDEFEKKGIDDLDKALELC